MKNKKILSIITIGILVLTLGACQQLETTSETSSEVVSEGVTTEEKGQEENESIENESIENELTEHVITKDDNEVIVVNDTEVVNSLVDTEDMFSERDLEQEADLEDATYIDLESNKTLVLKEQGVYVLTGNVSQTMILVEAEDQDKVQIVLDGVTIVNEDMPGIYVKSGDKVFITTTDSLNELEVSGDYKADGDVNLDAVIYAKSDVVFNGLGTLIITSNEGNGISGKDDLKITGGSYEIKSLKDAIEANDSIRIYDGNITIVTEKDGLHSENKDDLDLGYIYILKGNLKITSADDAIHGTSFVQIDGGNIQIPESVEGIEGTYIMINGGIINIYATDDGINATSLSDLDVMIEVNGGDITIVMASGDTDGFDANGDILINGGDIDVTGGSTFDADGSALLNAGTVIVNGVQVSELPESQMGRGKRK